MSCSLPVIDYPLCCAEPYTLAMGYIVNFQWFSKFIVSSSSPCLSFVQIQKMINCCSSWPARFYRILSFSVSSRVYEAYRKYTNSIRMHMGVISRMHTKGGKSLNSFGEIVYIYTRKLVYIYIYIHICSSWFPLCEIIASWQRWTVITGLPVLAMDTWTISQQTSLVDSRLHYIQVAVNMTHLLRV